MTTCLKKPVPQTSNSDIENAINGINELNDITNDSSHTLINDDCVIQQPLIDDTTTDESQINDNIIDEDVVTYPHECSNLSLIDVIKQGKDRMEEMDIGTHRKNIKEMRDCHDNFLSTAFEAMLTTIASQDGVSFDEINSQRSTTVSSYIVNFSMLKQRQNQQSNFINRFHAMTNM